MKISFSAFSPPASGVVFVLAGDGAELSGDARKLDEALEGHLTHAMQIAGFKGGARKSLDVILPGKAGPERVVIVGTGKPADMKPVDLELLGGAIAGLAGKLRTSAITVAADLPPRAKPDAAEAAAWVASGIRLRNYRFDKYKTSARSDKDKKKPVELKSVKVLTAGAPAARKAFAAHDAVATGVHIARDLVNEPANELHPQTFASYIKGLSKHGLKVEVLDEKQMAKLGMGALLGVAQGSIHKPRLCIMRWNGGAKGARPVAFIGKGVTFDTGGISIKPSSGMEDMKGDMGGAACVTGLMAALAAREAKVNAVGVVGLVENMPDGKAQRPGDIVKSMSGQTIAVLNTDAEGRLVLADALWYTQDRFSPKFMINLATLTGAILVALGKEHAGLFSNDDKLSDQITQASLATRERVWRMPLAPEYDKLIDSDVADMKNIGGRLAGSITAAQFLQRFVNKVPWAHLDVAGTAMDSPKSPISQSWASGWGVRLLDRLVSENFEK